MVMVMAQLVNNILGGEFDEVFEDPNEVDENIIIVRIILFYIFYFKFALKINKT
jgi:hypothetical protein